MGRRRLDAELVRRGLAASRSQAQAAVSAGRVTVAGITATKAASLVADDAPVALSGPPPSFVSRGGGKLAAALDRFAELDGVTAARTRGQRGVPASPHRRIAPMRGRPGPGGARRRGALAMS